MWSYTLLSVFMVSLISLVGLLALNQDPARIRRLQLYLVSLAVGSLLGGAFIHLLPEGAESVGTGLYFSVLLLAGFLGFFLLEKFLWHHHHGTDGHEEHDGSAHGRAQPIVAMVVLGNGTHNFLDGMVIAASFLVDPAVGLVTTLAVLLHEVPQEIGNFAVLVHGGLSVGRAVLVNFMSALTGFAGAILTLWIGSQVTGLKGALVTITAASFIYIAAADLIPELHRTREPRQSVIQVVMVAVGVGMMLGLALLPFAE